MFQCKMLLTLNNSQEDANGQHLTAPKINAEIVQVANAFLSGRDARDILHLRFSSVHLIKFIS